MRKMIRGIAVAAAAMAIIGCSDDANSTPDAGGNVVVGSTTVALDVSKPTMRTGESLLGDVVADAFLASAKAVDSTVVAAFANGGGVRCPDETAFPECIGYNLPAGNVTDGQIDDIFPFPNYIQIKTVTGAEIKEILERSVSSLPTAKGWFMQVSHGVVYQADCSGTAQIIDNSDATAANWTITTPGTRVTSVTIGGVAIVDSQTYKIAVSDYIGAGLDGHIGFIGAPSTDLADVSLEDSVIAYFQAHSPITPTIEGRVLLTGCSTTSDAGL
jgi:2',3'-cyclic-nucleotide 2'-phosphodiesterase (5'-nucleotidase family)